MTKQPKKAVKTPAVTLQGVSTPRIHTPLNDYPSKGQEMIDFCKEIGWPLLPWQEFVAIHAHKYDPEDGRWIHPEVGLIIARQNGKSTFMALRIIVGMYLWGEKLQVGTAHKLTTSSEIFWKIYEIIESSPKLSAEFSKKIESKGGQELKLLNGARYIIRANNAASRGISSPDTIHMDEVREYKDPEVWASMRYTQMASKNPQAWLYSNAGSQHSIILNQFRDRALARIAGADDNCAWFEWSGIPDVKIDGDNPKFWESICMANPSLGHTIHPNNIKAILNDEESIIRTEVLCNWVLTISPVINPSSWAANGNKKLKLDKEAQTWMAIDLSPDRKNAALVAAQKLADGNFLVVLLNTWNDQRGLDDLKVAGDVATWVKKYHTDVVAYSARTAGAVAARMRPAGINCEAVDGQDYATACDQMLGAINSGRLKHIDQEEFTKQALSAVKIPFGDGGWIMGRKVVGSTVIAATVGMAMVSRYATQDDSGDDIIVM